MIFLVLIVVAVLFFCVTTLLSIPLAAFAAWRRNPEKYRPKHPQPSGVNILDHKPYDFEEELEGWDGEDVVEIDDEEL